MGVEGTDSANQTLEVSWRGGGDMKVRAPRIAMEKMSRHLVSQTCVQTVFLF